MNIIKKIYKSTRALIAKYVLKGRFPYAYAHYHYWYHTRKELNWNAPKDFNQKLFWLARYWQDPRVVMCADKLSVRQYVADCGLGWMLNDIYAVYDNVNEINLEKLPQRFVLKTNHFGGGNGVFICKDKSLFDLEKAKRLLSLQANSVTGMDSCEYHYQYIEPHIYAEKYIGDENDNRLEIQFFCFNGIAKHILVRNDLGDAAKDSFAISYDINWNRVRNRKNEDLSIVLPRPEQLDLMIHVANTLAAPFPHVRIDLYYVEKKIIFGEMTFTTSGNILSNYTDETLNKWGEELVLPQKINCKWSNCYKSQLKRK